MGIPYIVHGYLRRGRGFCLEGVPFHSSNTVKIYLQELSGLLIKEKNLQAKI